MRLNSLVGGRLFPGKHHLATFQVKEEEGNYHVGFVSSDQTTLSIDAKETSRLDQNSIFENLESVSDFFEKGAIGYSPNQHKFDGLKLRPYTWNVTPLQVSKVQSSFFEDERVFPKGSIKFDNALLMRKIEHEWQSVADKYHRSLSGIDE